MRSMCMRNTCPSCARLSAESGTNGSQHQAPSTHELLRAALHFSSATASGSIPYAEPAILKSGYRSWIKANDEIHAADLPGGELPYARGIPGMLYRIRAVCSGTGEKGPLFSRFSAAPDQHSDLR